MPEPTAIRLKTSDGLTAVFERLRFGDEPDFAELGTQQCHDCGAEPGNLHTTLCDMEVCPACWGQFLSCGCESFADE